MFEFYLKKIEGKISCEACNKKCKGQALKLPTNKYFHLNCFTCKECRKDLSTEAYFMRENSYYCRFDYMRLFLAKCAQCNEYIEDDMIKVLNKSYHARCFKCSQCKKNIEAGEKMIIKKGEKVCQKCEAEESRTQQMGEFQMKVPEDSATNLINGQAAEALADNVHQCDQKLKVNGKDEMDVARKKLAEEMTDGKSAAINSPDSDYSMELKNLTDYSMDENVLLNSEQSDVHLFSPMSLTSGYKSDLSYNQGRQLNLGHVSPNPGYLIEILLKI
ncbi:hypothetical protein HELRODRAFT_177566 [Helobdella robusta]|uniref:LIM zinc-binding domain-containing protein n=1 Tax=Helobdella robusta TaxID=6412 RepID=T1FBV9_HELRO|nr:hypothetical protein HELRODRAFT_177566 [Helobdella robusta]ESN97909.1 hypothetical protein HELRODRAFT_177566 [Helobdella robusta]